MSDERVAQILRGSALFAGFDDEQLQVVPKVGRTRDYGPGDLIVREGAEPDESMWLLLDGEVEIRVAGEAIATLRAGDHFGEMSLLTDAPRAADVMAVGRVRALQFARSHLRGLIHSDPEVAMAVLAELSRRLRDLTETVAEMIEASPEAEAVARSRGITRGTDGPPAPLGPIEFPLVRGGGADTGPSAA